jgi:hypothetical protein
MLKSDRMSGELPVEDYLLPAPAIDLGIALADASAKFSAERSRIASQQERFDELFRLAEAEATPEQLEAIAARLSDHERQLAAILVPVIRSAELTIAKRLPRGAPPAQKSFYRLSEEAADIATTWLEACQNTQIRLYRLASEKLKAAGNPSVEIKNAKDLDDYFKEISE